MRFLALRVVIYIYLNGNVQCFTHNKSGSEVHKTMDKTPPNVEGATSFSNLSADTWGNNETFVTLTKLLDFYNTDGLQKQWNIIERNLSAVCMDDVNKYIAGLQQTKIWALKMDDASGRYSTGWFWGNHYWTGSRNLCENIGSPLSYDNDTIDNSSNDTSNKMTNTRRESISPSQARGYTPGRLKLTSVPPFEVAFFILRTQLVSSLTQEVKIIYIGLCLPQTCSNEDVKTLFEASTMKSSLVKVHIENVRSSHNYWNIWEDNTFRVISVCSLFTGFFVLSGTLYDYYLKRNDGTARLHPKKVHGSSCLTIDIDKTRTQTTNGNPDCTIVTRETVTAEVNGKENTCSPLPISTSVIFKDALLAFSARANLQSICDQSVGSDTIPIVHGLKTISMIWVILGHTCIIAFKYSDNMEYRRVVQKEFLFQTIANGAFSVDTFFFTSGLLVAFLYFRTNAKGKLETLTQGSNGFTSGCLHFVGLIFYRFARLTSPYLFVLGIVQVSMKWFYHNSVFEPPTMDHVNCPKYWWRNILYINTLFPVEEMCMLWSWYLSDDTQFYIVGAVILILATRYFKSAAALFATLMLSSWLTTAYVAYSNNHIPDPDDPMALFDKIYDKPWTRLGPYLIGMGVGWLLFKTNCRIPMSKLTVSVGWLLSAACLLSLVYGLYEANLSALTGAAYSSFSHSAWALGLAWIVVACSTGYGGLVNTILSAPVLYPLSRVTYCAYLIHPIVIRAMVMSMDSPLHLDAFVTIIIFLGQVVTSYILAFFISLFFEAPVVSMLRILTKFSSNH